MKYGPGHWRFLSRDDASQDFDPFKGACGPEYRTKMEALCDVERFAAFYGCTGPASLASNATSVNMTGLVK